MEIICYHTPNCNASSAGGIKAIRLLNFGKPLKSQIPIYLKERNHKIGRQKIINHDHDTKIRNYQYFAHRLHDKWFLKIGRDFNR